MAEQSKDKRSKNEPNGTNLKSLMGKLVRVGYMVWEKGGPEPRAHNGYVKGVDGTVVFVRAVDPMLPVGSPPVGYNTASIYFNFIEELHQR